MGSAVVAQIGHARPSEAGALSALHRRSSFAWEEDRAAPKAHPDALGAALAPPRHHRSGVGALLRRRGDGNGGTRHGGRYLARTTSIEQVEGEHRPPQVMLIIEWPSKEAADAFYESEEYRPHREARRQGASNEFRAR